MVIDGADNPVDMTANQEERIADAIEETAPIENLLEKALTACDSPECPIYNDGDPLGYYRQATEKLHLVNEAAGNHPDAAAFAVISPLYAEFLWPILWEGPISTQRVRRPVDSAPVHHVPVGRRRPSRGTDAGTRRLPGRLGAASGPGPRDSGWLTARPTMPSWTRNFPLLALLGRPLFSACPFYDQFAPEPLEGPLDGGGVPILVVGNHGDPLHAVHRIGRADQRAAHQRLSAGDLPRHAHCVPQQRRA